MACAPNITDFNPEEQTLLMVVHGTSKGSLAPRAACRAGACPRLAETTLPISTSWTCSAVTPEAFNAPSMAFDPNCVAESPDNEPPKLPIGVRTAETTNTSFI